MPKSILSSTYIPDVEEMNGCSQDLHIGNQLEHLLNFLIELLNHLFALLNGKAAIHLQYANLIFNTRQFLFKFLFFIYFGLGVNLLLVKLVLHLNQLGVKRINRIRLLLLLFLKLGSFTPQLLHRLSRITFNILFLIQPPVQVILSLNGFLFTPSA